MDIKSVSKVALVNNTGADLRAFEAHFLASVLLDGELPSELADTFKVTVIRVEDGLRGIIGWA